MSDNVLTGISFSDYDEMKFFSNESETSTNEKDKKLVFIKIVVICLAVLVGVEFILGSVVKPCLSPAAFELSGNTTLTNSEILAKLSSLDNHAWLSFDSSRAVDCISTISCVESVSVEKHFPNTVYINIKERESIARTMVSQNGRTTGVQIDKNGVIFSTSAENVLNNNGIPLVTGLPVAKIENGIRLPAKYRNLMEQIAEIAALPQKYFAAISEIHVVPKEYGNFELVLYPIHSKVKVLLDSSLTQEALEYMIVTLDVVSVIEADVTEIDLRYGSVSYRTK